MTMGKTSKDHTVRGRARRWRVGGRERKEEERGGEIRRGRGEKGERGEGRGGEGEKETVHSTV